jgi:predicted GIY-YIG superfamily endonuclease
VKSGEFKTSSLAWVYILRGTSGKFYIGSTDNLPRRLEQHQRGLTPSSKRLGLPLILIVSRTFATLPQARATERQLKSWKNSAKAIAFLKS